jgi:hypothetical protein
VVEFSSATGELKACKEQYSSLQQKTEKIIKACEKKLSRLQEVGLFFYYYFH